MCMCIAQDIQEYRRDLTGSMLGSGASFTYEGMCRRLSDKQLSDGELRRRWNSLQKVGGAEETLIDSECFDRFDVTVDSFHLTFTPAQVDGSAQRVIRDARDSRFHYVTGLNPRTHKEVDFYSFDLSTPLGRGNTLKRDLLRFLHLDEGWKVPGPFHQPVPTGFNSPEHWAIQCEALGKHAAYMTQWAPQGCRNDTLGEGQGGGRNGRGGEVRGASRRSRRSSRRLATKLANAHADSSESEAWSESLPEAIGIEVAHTTYAGAHRQQAKLWNTQCRTHRAWCAMLCKEGASRQSRPAPDPPPESATPDIFAAWRKVAAIQDRAEELAAEKRANFQDAAELQASAQEKAAAKLAWRRGLEESREDLDALGTPATPRERAQDNASAGSAEEPAPLPGPPQDCP